ncbi:YxeA family protein [Listeria kieliensis]
MKRAIFGLLAAVFVIVMVFIELSSPFAEASDTYTVTIKHSGEKVQKAKFKGYAFKEDCKAPSGKTTQLKFYSNDELEMNKSYRLVIQDNQMVVRSKELSDIQVVSSK